MTWKIVNAVGYQAVWFACALGAARGVPEAGLAASVIFATLVLWFGGQWRADLRLMAAALLFGLLFDSSWIALGWIDYRSPWPAQYLAPPWILCIWTAFALTLNHSLAFLKHRYVLAAALGAVGGPLAYWSASHGMGVLRFEVPAAWVLAALGVSWAVALPLLVRLGEWPWAPTIATEASA